MPDSDGDGFKDDVDRCPEVAGTENRYPDELGCPPRPCLSIVQPTEIEITLQLELAERSAELGPETAPIIDELARTLNEHPELAHVEVIGHADAKEPKGLALARAENVRAALIARGVDGARLTPRAANGDSRKVEFAVLSEREPPPSGPEISTSSAPRRARRTSNTRGCCSCRRPSSARRRPAPVTCISA